MLPPRTRVRRYEVSEPLGAGGMGEVYLARDVELDRTVALKILPSDGTGADPERVRRFLQEARAAIALSHPNVAHIYDVGDDNGIRFMAMEYVEGQTLRTRVQRGAVPLDEAVDIAHQIALALASAHAAGIVHRDVKPENVMLRPDGYVKVLDFGLAKLTVATTPGGTDVIHTEPGLVMGTMQYMSPEQLKGGDVDARSDVFALGVVLYELVSGHRPFEASTPSGVIAAILTEQPQPIENAPDEIRDVVEKALAKKPEERFASAREMAAALKKTRQQESSRIRSGDLPTQVLTSAPARTRGVRPAWWIAAALLAIALGAGGWWWTRTQRIAEARAALPKLEQLADEHRYFEAWDLAKSIEPLAGREPQFIRALDKSSIKFSATSEPSGAQVFLRRVLPSGEVGERVAAGVTPLRDHVIARGDYIVTYEKEGFAAVERPFAGAPLLVNRQEMPLPPSPTDVKLVKQSDVPEGMVFVEGGSYGLTGWMLTSREKIPLVPFFIDKYEVSNAQFEQFVRSGGYRRRELWKHPFVNDGKTLTFEDAMALFRDTTGFPGPRSWAQGKYPQGRENYPVTDISWYEAAAFAEHAGKKLPTMFQWDKAARNSQRSPFGNIFPWGVVPLGVDISRRANFRGGGPLPVGSLPSGMSAWGVYDLAGNVTEWARNPNEDGMATTGGAFDDPTYMFAYIGAFPPSYASAKIGFRCVRERGSGGDQGSFSLSDAAKPPAYTPAGPTEFARIRRLFDYDARAPLNAKQIERLDTPDWVREKFSYTGANGKTALAYLYLPKGAQPPFQVVHFMPPADVSQGSRPLEVTTERILGGVMRGGRAVFAVVLEGYLGRPRPPTSHVVTATSEDPTSDLVDETTDVRRGLDVLATRGDVDLSRLAFFGASAASSFGFIISAVDDRYDAVAVSGSGLPPSIAARPASVMRINCLPYIRANKLMIHGKYDEAHPWKVNAEPLFALMQKNKEVIFFDGGHIPDGNWLVVTLTKWLDKQFGPAR